MHAHVVNGVVAEVVKALPRTATLPDGGKTGDLQKMTLAEQLAAGWYPLEDQNLAVTAAQYLVPTGTYDIQGDKVIRLMTVTNHNLADLKAKKIGEVNDQENVRLEMATFVFQGKTFKAGSESSQQATSFQALLSSGAAFPPGMAWTAADGTSIALDAAGFTQFGQLMGSVRLTISGVAVAHRAAIMAESDALTVAQYDTAAGWP